MVKNSMKTLLVSIVAPLLLCLPLVGCSKAPPEKNPEEIEKVRQEHIKRAERELADG